MTLVVPVDAERPEQAVMERAAAVIRAGGLVAFPTETVYGLGANALDAEAVRKIYQAKQRAAHDPCIVHIAALEDLERVAVLPMGGDAARRLAILAGTCWPGPLSLILPRAPSIPDVVTAGRATVAVRMPGHPVAMALIRASGTPIAAPSANTFMHTSPTTARHVLDDLQGRIEMVLDGGPSTLGVESTVLDLTDGIPTILRPGGVGIERLIELLGEVRVAQPRAEEGGAAQPEALPAPGMLEKHYAPHAPLILLSGSQDPVRAELARRARTFADQGRLAGALLPDQDAAALAAAVPHDLRIACLGPAGDLQTIASRLYAGMRELEAAGAQVILARSIEGGGLGRAIQDRLRRAAGGEVIVVPE